MKVLSEYYIDQCPMLQAFGMGESHEEMQLLFLCQLKADLHKWSSDPDQQIIAMIPNYAMQYSTPFVFFDAIGVSGGANICDKGEIDYLSPLMHTLEQVALYSTDPAKCAKTMENVFEILDRYPAMAWQRLEASKGLSPEYPDGTTALGLLVFYSMPAGYQPLFNQWSVEIVEIDRQKNMAIRTYMSTEFIPKIFTRMLCPMRVAFAMATHVRLGASETCCAKGLSTEMIDIIFNGLVRTSIESPAVLQEILC